MNASTSQYEAPGAEFRVSFREEGGTRNSPSARRPKFGRKRGKGPQLFNGIHRRRKKKINW